MSKANHLAQILEVVSSFRGYTEQELVLMECAARMTASCGVNAENLSSYILAKASGNQIMADAILEAIYDIPDNEDLIAVKEELDKEFEILNDAIALVM